MSSQEHNREPAGQPVVALPPVDGPALIKVLVLHYYWQIMEHNQASAGLRKHGHLGPLMIPMKRGQVLTDEFVRHILSEAHIEPEDFAAIVQNPDF